jgi:hypothetical protein
VSVRWCRERRIAALLVILAACYRLEAEEGAIPCGTAGCPVDMTCSQGWCFRQVPAGMDEAPASADAAPSPAEMPVVTSPGCPAEAGTLAGRHVILWCEARQQLERIPDLPCATALERCQTRAGRDTRSLLCTWNDVAIYRRELPGGICAGMAGP